MANNIKGITVEIGGDTTPLNKALKSANDTGKSLQDQLKEVNRQLKFDPSNTVLLQQKQELLTKEIENTSQKLSTLKDAEKQAQEQFERGKISQAQYQALQREVIKTESQLKELGKQAGLTNAALDKISTTTADVAEGAEKMADATKGASTIAIGILGGTAAAAGKVVSAFADTEQLVGGVETLFKDAAGTVSEYADQAYKTAGLSANEYMETVTGFSASLIQSLDGDTAKAAQYADMAITDMSDNANKMGSDMGSIQNAYQGFAKQNYTMLDNLKLGYGGTKEEMQRLLDDAGKIAGVKFDISSYSDVVDAIHVMQENMGIAGTTAKEAEGTISGSIDMAKSSIANLVSGLGQSGADIDKLTQDVVDAVTTAVQNVIPVLKNLMDNLPSGVKIALGITAVIATVAPVLLIVSKIASGISAVTGAMAMAKTATIAQTAAQYGWNAALLASPITWIVVGIAAVVAAVVLLFKNCKPFHDWVMSALKTVESVAKTAFNAIVTFFTVTIPGAWRGLVSFFRGISAWWSNLWTQVGQFFKTLWNGIISFFTTTIPQWVNSFIQWIQRLPYNIGVAIGTMLAHIVNFGVKAWAWITTTLPQIIRGIINWFAQLPGEIWSILTDIIVKIGLWVSNMVLKVATEVPKIISRVVNFFAQLPGKIWSYLANVVSKVIQWAANLVSTAATEIPKFVSTVVNFIGELPGKMLDIGANIVKGIWNGINSAIDWLHSMIADFCSGIINGFKTALQIHSPSQLFADIVGKNIALGIGQGFIGNMKSVVATMTDAIPTTWDTGIQVRTALAYGGAYSYSGDTSEQTSESSPTAGGDITVKQYFQGKVPTPAETARQTRNGLKQVIKQLKG